MQLIHFIIITATYLAPKDTRGWDLYLEFTWLPNAEGMLYVDGPGFDALSFSSRSLYVRGPVLNLTPIGLLFVDSADSPLRIFSVSYSTD